MGPTMKERGMTRKRKINKRQLTQYRIGDPSSGATKAIARSRKTLLYTDTYLLSMRLNANVRFRSYMSNWIKILLNKYVFSEKTSV